ncbi:MAG TPA: alanine--glyoxylate aminotransferase family protein [bacterium]|nr:alanine--glyoxylate aminotransferase family protein [bacterium]HEX68522.1 alanine--glyoxylate aminotransferase family protein [bacterium]
MRKKFLFTPGPTPLPPEVQEALSRPIIHHRTTDYQEIFAEVNEGLKYIFQTENPVFTFASSGTGVMEAAVVNLTREGEKALAIVGGKFGERWKEILEAFGRECVSLDVEWGSAPRVEEVEKILDKNPDVEVVFATLCETSTGTKTDIKSLAELCNKKGKILVVDAISGLVAMELRTDEWGVDVVVAGSQKGIMLPPGLAFLSINEKAWKKIENNDIKAYYFDLKKTKKAYEKTDTPFTPAVGLIVALRESLRMIKEEGLENIWKKFSLISFAVREAVKTLGLEIFSRYPAEAVTAVKVPQGIDGIELYKAMKEKIGVQVAGGQAHLKGKIIRIAHMGYMDYTDAILAISALETALSILGYSVEFGKGVGKVMEIFLKEGVFQ